MKKLKNFIITGVLLMAICALPVNTSAKEIDSNNFETTTTGVTYAVVENGKRCLATTDSSVKADRLVEINKDYCENLTIIRFDKPVQEMTLEEVEENL